MPQAEHHDFLILGSGQGGKLLALRSSRGLQELPRSLVKRTRPSDHFE
jgi:hypothetical protein